MRIDVSRNDLEQFVAEQVKQGAFPDAEAVVEEALDRLKEARGMGVWTEADLKEAVTIGREELARGEGTDLKGDQELDEFFDNIKREGRSRIERRSTPQ